MTKISLIRLPDDAAGKVEKYGKERGLAFATAVRCIVVEHFAEQGAGQNESRSPELKVIESG